jgi:hypothetical protein
MRLLNSKALELTEFLGGQPPKFAILSHRWGEEEVSFQEIQTPTPRKTPKKGYYKIKHCAERALSDNLQWIWVDTCCIDKSSSAELSEIINSMYKIYQQAEVYGIHIRNGSHKSLIRRCYVMVAVMRTCLMYPTLLANWRLDSKTAYTGRVDGHCRRSSHLEQ